MKVHDGNRMLVPLYHGTSRIFLPSIKETGLGAKNPNLALDTLDFLGDIAHTIQLNWSEEPGFALDMVAVRPMLEQRVTGGGFNFRHSNTYLSAAQWKAVGYALNNIYGSELLSQALSLFAKLKTFDKANADQIASKYPAVVDVASLAHQPLLVEILHVPIQDLRSERGGDPTDLFGMMEDDSDMGKIMLQGCNFELLVAQPPKNLRYYDVERKNTDPIFPAYVLHPCS